MAKEITFSVAKPPSEELLQQIADFWVQAAAKSAGYSDVKGTLFKRPPGDTGSPIKNNLRPNGAEAS